jgi:hypothetical protein
MRILTSPEQVLPLVREWLNLLAQDNYEAAQALLYCPAKDLWTPQFLRKVVANDGTLKHRKDGKVFQVTPISSAVYAPDRNNIDENVEWFDAQRWQHLSELARDLLYSDSLRPKSSTLKHVGLVWHTVPLNGQWGNMTAIFWVNAYEQNYVLELEDVDGLGSWREGFS